MKLAEIDPEELLQWAAAAEIESDGPVELHVLAQRWELRLAGTEPLPIEPQRRAAGLDPPTPDFERVARDALIALEDPARDRSGEAARLLRDAIGGEPLRNARHTGAGL